MDLWFVISGGIAAIIIGLAIIIAWILMKEKRSGYPLKDERTQKITGKAAMYALYIGMYSTCALLFVNIISREFYGFYAFEEGYALSLSLIIYGVSFIILRVFFNSRGD
jgi:uncharacterized membrane protein